MRVRGGGVLPTAPAIQEEVIRLVAEVESGDGVLRHIVKISVAQYNVKAAHTTTNIQKIVKQVG